MDPLYGTTTTDSNVSNAKLYASLWVTTARSDTGCVTKMLLKLDLPALLDRREQQRLLFFYKMVEWLVSAMPIDRPISETTTETRDRLNTISGLFLSPDEINDAYFSEEI